MTLHELKEMSKKADEMVKSFREQREVLSRVAEKAEKLSGETFDKFAELLCEYTKEASALPAPENYYSYNFVPKKIETLLPELVSMSIERDGAIRLCVYDMGTGNYFHFGADGCWEYISESRKNMRNTKVENFLLLNKEKILHSAFSLIQNRMDAIIRIEQECNNQLVNRIESAVSAAGAQEV